MTLQTLNENAFTQAVSNALKQFGSLLTLSRSVLASAEILQPALILDAVSPSVEERGQALQLILRWAVTRLAPSAPAPAWDSDRPFDDPTWRDPLWWGYNILRHRYIEPLHPDDFVDGGRFTETLLSLTGIPNEAAYYDVRNRAIREVTQQLRTQVRSQQANATIRHLALDEALAPLERQPAMQQVLGMGAIFRGVFPRLWLDELISAERLPHASRTINQLIQQRFLRANDHATELWLSPTLRDYLYHQQNPRHVRRWQRQIATRYAQTDDTLSAAWHWVQASEFARAAQLLLTASQALIHDLQIEPLREALTQFRPNQLPPALMLDIYLLHADVTTQLGDPDAARRLCRSALPLAHDSIQKGRVLRRLGKLYEAHDRTDALNYYQQAAAHLPLTHPGLVDLYTDRAWLFILGKEWDSAENDLQHALNNLPTLTTTQRANLYDAYSILHSRQANYTEARTYVDKAISLREASGDLLRISRSKHNLGIIYNALGQYERAIHIFGQAIEPYRQLGNQVEMATSLLSLGVSHHYLGDLAQAVTCYGDCLALAKQVKLSLMQVKAHANLAEALAELGHKKAAQHHWQQGFYLARQHEFTDQISYFHELQIQFPSLKESVASLTELPEAGNSTTLQLHSSTVTAGNSTTLQLHSSTVTAGNSNALDSLGSIACQLATETGKVTARRLMEAGSVSKATATRRLAKLVQAGYLLKKGQRRGTHYVLARTGIVGEAGVVSAELSPATLQTLQQLLPHISQQFSVQQLTPAPQQHPHIALNITFSATPTLATFLQTRTYLQQQLNATISLHLTQDS